jgi:hypothetical protein
MVIGLFVGTIIIYVSSPLNNMCVIYEHNRRYPI